MTPTNDANIERVIQKLHDAFRDSHMQPDIEPGEYWEIDMDDGSSFVLPASVAGHPAPGLDAGACLTCDDDDLPAGVDVDARDDWFASLADYVPEGCGGMSTGIVGASLKAGYVARMSAPGYLDSTDYAGYEGLEDAVDDLIANYAAELDEHPATPSPGI